MAKRKKKHVPLGGTFAWTNDLLHEALWPDGQAGFSSREAALAAGRAEFPAMPIATGRFMSLADTAARSLEGDDDEIERFLSCLVLPSAESGSSYPMKRRREAMEYMAERWPHGVKTFSKTIREAVQGWARAYRSPKGGDVYDVTDVETHGERMAATR